MNKAICFAVVLVLAPVAFGQAIQGFSGGAEYTIYHSGSTGDVVGWRFSLAEAKDITNLGVWNMDQTGMMDTPHLVGIWDDMQALVCSVTVVPGGTVVGDWIYAPITPVTLVAGTTYTIGALYTSDDNDYYISGASSATTDPDVTWINAVYPLEGSLNFAYPETDSPASSVGRFGPNFLFTETALEQTTWGAIKASM